MKYFKRLRFDFAIERHYGMRKSFIRFALPIIWDDIVCLVRGHDWIDSDPGNPEVGPRPEIFCSRCGRDA